MSRVRARARASHAITVPKGGADEEQHALIPAQSKAAWKFFPTCRPEHLTWGSLRWYEASRVCPVIRA
jgi:hypothetical protein